MEVSAPNNWCNERTLIQGLALFVFAVPLLSRPLLSSSVVQNVSTVQITDSIDWMSPNEPTQLLTNA